MVLNLSAVPPYSKAHWKICPVEVIVSQTEDNKELI